MSDKLITSTVTVLIAIIGVATIAILVSHSANTSGVLSASGSSLSCALRTALSPILGTATGCTTASLPIGVANSTITFG